MDEPALTSVAAERRRLEERLPGFLDSLCLPGAPFGRCRFHAAQQQPWLFYASQQALSMAVRHGLWEQLPPEARQEWLDLLLLAQDPESGLFRCPVETEQPVAYYRAITIKLVRRLDSIGLVARHPLPRAEEICPPLPELPQALAELPWETQVYSSGSQAGHWAMTRAGELHGRGEPLAGDDYLETIIGFLESRQDTASGLWGSSPRLDDGINGVLKTLSVYQELGRPLPRAEAILDSLLRLQAEDGSFGDSCTPWNVLELLSFLVRQTDHRRHAVAEAALSVVPALRRRLQPDGLYSATAVGCLTVHAGVRLCAEPQPVGDIQGTSQTLDILKLVEALATFDGPAVEGPAVED